MAFRHFLKRAERGVAINFSRFFSCSGLEETIWAPNQSFLMKKVKNYRNKWHSAISWKRRNGGMMHSAINFSRFFSCSGLEETIWAPNQSFLVKKVKNYWNKWHSAISWKRRNGGMMHSATFRSIPPLSAFPPFPGPGCILISLSTQTLLAPASGASKGLRILQDFGKVVCSCSTPIYNGYYKTNFWIPNLPPYILKHNVEMTALICKIIVSIVASAHELRYNHTKF